MQDTTRPARSVAGYIAPNRLGQYMERLSAFKLKLIAIAVFSQSSLTLLTLRTAGNNHVTPQILADGIWWTGV